MKSVKEAPTFSVLIPSYNRPELLVQTVESVLTQSYTRFELIISDDASPRSAEISAALKRFSNDDRLELIIQPKNLGWSDNRNALLAEANGDFVMLLGDDDLVPANTLERLHSHISHRKNSEVIAFGYEVIDPTGQHSYTRHAPSEFSIQVDRGNSWKEVFYYDLLPMWAFHPFTMCCRRERAIEWGYDKRCGIGDDVFFLYRALDSGCRIDVLPDVLFTWRRALKSTKGYQNLSSSGTADGKARRAVWMLAQQTRWSKPAVQELVHSEQFAWRLLGLPKAISNEVAALGKIGTDPALAEIQSIWDKIDPAQRHQDNKLIKLNRLRRIGGIKYPLLSLVSTFDRFVRATRRAS